jgi:lactate dehydrogenase-like 2-hydroxyacid dehydrogenase
MAINVVRVGFTPPVVDERLLAGGYVVHEVPDGALEHLDPATAPLVRALTGPGNGRFPGDLIRALPNLELIAVVGVGYDGVDVAAARERSVAVTNTPDVLTEDVADIALALMLNVSRELCRAHNYVIAGEWERGEYPLTRNLGGKTCGIVGLGRIGKAIARRALASRMRVAYHGRSRQSDVDFPYYPSVTVLAAASDFLVLSAPGGEATRNLVGAAVLNALGADGVFINVARGSLVDEPALISALRDRRIRAAGLDVFPAEPRVAAELRALTNVVLLPHVGSATEETRRAMGALAMDNLDAHFAGRPLLTRVV